MTEPRPGESGAANMPPFPPLHTSQPEPPDADEQASRTFAGAASGAVDDFDDEAPAGSGPSAPRGARDHSAPRSFSRTARDRVRYRTQTTLQRGLEAFADRLEEVAERIEHVADDRLQGSPARDRAGDLAQTAAAQLDALADYLRTSDVDRMRVDLEFRVRERPLQSLIIAAAAGWMVGKIVR